ncbi:MAG: adenylate/guanylate cyclase domain-containing protein [Pseudomonadota bacterium]
MCAEQRKLATFMFTDMVGYSALTQKNDTLAVELLTAHREILRTIFPKHAGRELDAVGDGFLVEFASAVDASRCAVEIQETLAARNAATALDRRIQVRIGLHLGDVVVRDGRAHGDGVNIAARIEPLADPGGICLSEDVARQVRNKIELPLRKLGKGDLKNIQTPVDIYKVILPGARGHLPFSERIAFGLRQRRTRRIVAGALAVMIVALLGSVYVWQRTKPVTLPVPDKPSIAVLPFANLSGVAAEDYFVDGLVEDIITQLSHFRELFVIARNSTFQYKGKAIDVRQVGRELGVRYVLEGSARRTTDKIRVTAQLIDASTGGHIWAGKYDERLQDIFSVQDRLTSEIAGALGVSIRDVEREHALAKASKRLTTYDLLLRAGQMWAEISPAEHLKVRELVERAVRLDPNYARAQAALAFVYLDEFRFKFNPHPDRPDPLASALERAELAVRLDPADAYTHYALAKSLYFAKKLDRCEQEFGQAFRLNPNFADAKADFGIRLAMIGRQSEGAALTREAMRLNPLYPRWYHFTFAIEAFQHRQFQRAIDETEKIAMPQFYMTSAFLAAANAHLGRMNEARAAMRQLLKLYPEFPNNWDSQANLENLSENYKAVLDEGFRKVGLFNLEAGKDLQ